MKKKVISMLLAAAMTVSMVSGMALTAAAEESTGKELSVQVGPNPETLDPALNSAVDGGNMILHTFECLLTVDQDGKIAPGQAETWETSEDGLTWTFHLRDGLKWSDGSDLTAGDFEYSWKRVCDPEVAAPYADTVLSMVKGFDEAIEGDLDALAVKAADDFEERIREIVTVNYRRRKIDELARFNHVLSYETAQSYDDETLTATITLFDFKIRQAVDSEDSSTILNDVSKPHVRFSDVIGAEEDYAYQNGEVLFIKDVPTEEIPSLQDNDEFHVDPIIGTYYLSFNTQVEPLDNPLVRKALSLAIDREYVANTLMQGTYSPAVNFMGPGWKDTDGSDFIDNANGGEPYLSANADIEAAKEALAEAGYPDGEGLPVLHYITNDAGYHKAVAEALHRPVVTATMRSRVTAG